MKYNLVDFLIGYMILSYVICIIRIVTRKPWSARVAQKDKEEILAEQVSDGHIEVAEFKDRKVFNPRDDTGDYTLSFIDTHDKLRYGHPVFYWIMFTFVVLAFSQFWPVDFYKWARNKS